MIDRREERFFGWSRRPRHRIAIYWLWMSLWCSFGVTVGRQGLTHDVTLEDYTELILRYRRGDHRDASRALANWNREQVDAAGLEFRQKRPDPGQIKAAALLHTEIILLRLDDYDFHLNHARIWIRELAPPAREAFERRWLLMLGYFYMKSFGSGDTSAIQEAQKAFLDDVELHITFGALNETSGWMGHDDDALGMAETQYRIVLDAEPDHAEALIRLGRILALTGQDKDAYDRLKRGLERTQDARLQLAGLLSLGEVHLERGETAEAVQSFRAALALDPACQTSVMALAIALHKTGDSRGSRRVIHEYFLPKKRQPSSSTSSREFNLWWRYLLDKGDCFESLLAELRKETRL